MEKINDIFYLLFAYSTQYWYVPQNTGVSYGTGNIISVIPVAYRCNTVAYREIGSAS